MGLLLKLHLSSYVARNTQDFSITVNVIVLFLLRVMKDVIAAKAEPILEIWRENSENVNL